MSQKHQILIKYDPYMVKTDITVDGKPVDKNSKLNIRQGMHFDDFVDRIPSWLKREYRCLDFDISFNGRKDEYDMLVDAAKRVNRKYGMNIVCSHTAESFKQTTSAAANSSEAYTEAEDVADIFDEKEESVENIKQKFVHKRNVHEVYIKYNTYTVNTTILVDGNPVKANGALANNSKKRLQEWVEDLPQILQEEYNSNRFQIVFRGTDLDYEDLEYVVNDASKSGFEITCKHEPVRDIKDIISRIDKIFQKIQNGPFEELKTKKIQDAYEKVKNNTFPINVVATMSSGKSTLINALLGIKLMPSSNEACTALITEIQDKDDAKVFSANVYDKHGQLIKTVPNLTLDIMEELNSKKDIAKIEVSGNIPFVASDDNALVLVDTPGTNNSIDPAHKKATMDKLDRSSSMVLYIMNATQLKTNDDSYLLNQIAEKMRESGKLSRDRFLFVLNKADEFNEDDDLEKTLKTAKSYLEGKGIESPNIFPASALTALGIKTKLKGIDTKVDIEELMTKYRRKDRKLSNFLSDLDDINYDSRYHFEKYADLAKSQKIKIENMLAKAREEQDFAQEALIHSGIISIETAIKMYVEKYARPIKIRHLLDSFQGKMKDSELDVKLKKNLKQEKGRAKDYSSKINVVLAKLNDSKKLKTIISDEMKIIFDDSDITRSIRKIIQPAVEEVRRRSADMRGRKLYKNDAEYEGRVFEDFARNIDINVQRGLEKLINDTVNYSINKIMNTYETYVKDLSGDLSGLKIAIEPFKLAESEFRISINKADLYRRLKTEEQVLDRVETREIDNPERSGFFGFFKFWKPSKIEKTENIYRTVEYVDGGAWVDTYLRGFTPHLTQYGEDTENYIELAKSVIEKNCMEKSREINKLIDKKMNEYKDCVEGKETVENNIVELNKKITWIDSISAEINNIIKV